MKIGLVGYQGSGKSTLFEWITGETADPSQAFSAQTAMAAVPEPRVEPLCEIYQPKKITLASLEIVDTPGLSRDHSGSAQKLALIREAGCLVIVVADFGGNDAKDDISNFDADLLIADLDIISGRIERLREQVKKPRPDRDELQKELEVLEPMHAALEEGKALRDLELNPDQEKMVRSFQLLTLKPRLILVNSGEEAVEQSQYEDSIPEGADLLALNIGLEQELDQMDESERDEFISEMGIERSDRDHLIRKIMHVSEQMLFFTAGEKEVRTWMIRKGGTAVEAAGNIHTDLAQGFIRAETMNIDDLVRLGSEREVKAENLLRREPREYVIQDGDIITIQHN
ncbi:MAG: DUF933 domain-containing protein [Pirellulales bacterium]|nr:DUF933 domain-containing protein [Pirellulales bacterium]